MHSCGVSLQSGLVRVVVCCAVWDTMPGGILRRVGYAGSTIAGYQNAWPYARSYYVSLRSDLIREASNFDAMEQSIKLASAREAKAVSCSRTTYIDVCVCAFVLVCI